MQSFEEWVMDVKEQAYLSIQDDDVTEDNFDDMIDLPCQDILDAKVENMSSSELYRLIAEYGVQGAIDLYVELNGTLWHTSNTELNRLIAELGIQRAIDLCIELNGSPWHMDAEALLYTVMEDHLEHLITYEDYRQWRQSRRNE